MRKKIAVIVVAVFLPCLADAGNVGEIKLGNDAKLRLQGFAQIDSRTFVQNDNIGDVDTLLVRTARPSAELKIGEAYAARVTFDFGGSQTRLIDAYADYKPEKSFNIRMGKFKSAIGLERWQSEQDLSLVERGLTNNLVPFREVGVQFYGDVMPEQLEYQLGFTNGTLDIKDSNVDSQDAKDITARLFGHPTKELGIGLAGSVGTRNGSAANPSVTDGYRSNSQAKIFRYASGAYADGTEWRINPQAYYYSGPFGVLGEYVRTENEAHRGANSATLAQDAWTVLASYVLTGEKASIDGVKVREAFDPESGAWGAWEVVGRLSELHLDDKAFPLYADPAKSVRDAREWVAGLNWYVNDNLKWNANYAYTTFNGGAAGGADRQTEQVVLNRLQIRF